MSLDQLDARQRAMLAEMGIRLFDAFPMVPPQDSASSEVPRPAVAVARATPVATNEAAPAPTTPAPTPVVAPMARQEARSLPSGEREQEIATLDWPALQEAVSACRACGLCESRRNTVFGVGDRQADWMIVGEAPGEQEDLEGEPFVGQAGKLLDNMLRAVGLDRTQRIYIANVLKCRPPANRNPDPAEVAQCEPYLRRQVALVRPKLILAMGRFAVQSLLGTTEPIGRLRGRVHDYQGVPVVVTYHPAYLLRNLPDKAKAWADLCLALEVAGAAEVGTRGSPPARG